MQVGKTLSLKYVIPIFLIGMVLMYSNKTNAEETKEQTVKKKIIDHYESESPYTTEKKIEKSDDTKSQKVEAASEETEKAPEKIIVLTHPGATKNETREVIEPVENRKKTIGINLNIGLFSHYYFRGQNMFKENSQQDSNAMFSPSVSWSVFDTGLSLGYLGAYQITGNNITEMVDVGLGHEQDAFLGYDIGLADDLMTLSLLFTYVFYPFADENSAGTKNPSYIEPYIGYSLATIIDIGIGISYFHAIQEELSVYRYVYFNLTAGKEVELNETFGINIGMGFGAKIWVEDVEENRFDLVFNWSIPIQLTDPLYVEPGIHLGWTDLNTISTGQDDDPLSENDESIRKATAGDEFMVYGSVNVGADF